VVPRSCPICRHILTNYSSTRFQGPFRPLSRTMGLTATCRAGRAGSRLLRPFALRQHVDNPCRYAPKHKYHQQSHPLPHSSSFYSHEQPIASPPGAAFGRIEGDILAAAYAHVPEHGFTHRALSLGAKDVGLLDMSPSALADGPFSLIRWHMLTQRGAMEKRARELDETAEGASMSVGRKVEALTWARLLGNKDIIHRWQEVCVQTQASLPNGFPPGHSSICVIFVADIHVSVFRP
jgi:hypothetical protein